LLNGGAVLAADVLFAFVCGVINAIIDLVAGIFIFIGMVLTLVTEALKAEAEYAANVRYYNFLAMEYLDNFTQALKKVDWNKVITTTVSEYLVFMYVTLPALLLNTTINPREVGYYIGYIGLNIIICFIPIVDLVQLAKVKQMAGPFRKLFEAILNLLKKAGSAVAKTAGGLLRLFEDFTEMLRKGTEEVVNFVKKVFAAVKAWLEELAGVNIKLREGLGNIEAKILAKADDLIHATIVAFEDGIRLQKFESAMFFSEDGIALGKLITQGEEASVVFKEIEILKARSQLVKSGGKYHEMIVTHNHPGGSGLSASDIEAAIMHYFKEIRAVGKTEDGVDIVYSLKRKGGIFMEEIIEERMDVIKKILQKEFPLIHPNKFKHSLLVQKRKAELLVETFRDYVDYTIFK
jgi:hypothetical protein